MGAAASLPSSPEGTTRERPQAIGAVALPVIQQLSGPLADEPQLTHPGSGKKLMSLERCGLEEIFGACEQTVNARPICEPAQPAEEDAQPHDRSPSEASVSSCSGTGTAEIEASSSPEMRVEGAQIAVDAVAVDAVAVDAPADPFAALPRPQQQLHWPEREKSLRGDETPRAVAEAIAAAAVSDAVAAAEAAEAARPARPARPEGTPLAEGAAVSSAIGEDGTLEGEPGAARKRPRGARMRAELADSTGFAVQWHAPEKGGAAAEGGGRARPISLSLNEDIEVGGGGRRSLRSTGGDLFLVGELYAHVEVPIGPRHQVEPPRHLGPWRAVAEGAAVSDGEAQQLAEAAAGAATAASGAVGASERELEIEAARATAARLTAAAHGAESELTGRYLPVADDLKVYDHGADASPSPLQRSASGGALSSAEDGGAAEEYTCERCGKVLCRQGALTMHARYCKARLPRARRSGEQELAAAAGGTPPAVPAEAAGPAEATAEYDCEGCGRIFGTAGGLTRHLKVCAKAPASASGGGAGAKRKRSKAEKQVEAELMAQPDVFVVECLLGERMTGSGARRRKQFLVRWHGYGDEDNTWEDADAILDVRRAPSRVKHALKKPPRHTLTAVGPSRAQDDLIDEYRRMKRQAAQAEKAAKSDVL